MDKEKLIKEISKFISINGYKGVFVENFEEEARANFIHIVEILEIIYGIIRKKYYSLEIDYKTYKEYMEKVFKLGIILDKEYRDIIEKEGLGEDFKNDDLHYRPIITNINYK